MYGSYSKLMLKLFLAEAVLTNHSALVASADVDPQQLTKVYIEISTSICLWCTTVSTLCSWSHGGHTTGQLETLYITLLV